MAPNKKVDIAQYPHSNPTKVREQSKTKARPISGLDIT
ncbi:uncharacterized protein G2W53_015418 [Senna tora]|uniref:Uncharacterized protein n=1 Tax=Senna tora TaxID=362788 RepID=A0A835C7L2_9FABA|nr:uncharacterized protein G2W53_015418 [Senna tora]